MHGHIFLLQNKPKCFFSRGSVPDLTGEAHSERSPDLLAALGGWPLRGGEDEGIRKRR